MEFDASRVQKSYISVFAGGAKVYGNETVPHSIGKAAVSYVAYRKPAVVNQRLAIGGTLSGTIYQDSQPYGFNLRVVPVAIFGAAPNRTVSTLPTRPPLVSTPNKFSLTGLPTGYYSISVDGPGNTYSAYVDPYVDPDLLPAEAKIYSVKAGATRSGISVDFKPEWQGGLYPATGALSPALMDGGGTIEIGHASRDGHLARSRDSVATTVLTAGVGCSIG